MPYSPTNWQTGDIVTSEKLNKIEAGIVNFGLSPLKITASKVPNAAYGMPYQLDATAGDIVDALNSGRLVYVEHFERIYYRDGVNLRIDHGTNIIWDYNFELDANDEINSISFVVANTTFRCSGRDGIPVEYID